MLVAANASAEPLPFAATSMLGRPGRAVHVEATVSDEGLTVSASIGGRRAQVLVRAPGIDDVTLERVEVAPGHHVGIVRGTGSRASIAALITVRGGAPHVPWSARTDWHGDPGERTAGVIELEDRTGDGRPDVVVGVHREGATLCGDQSTLLLARAYDPSRGELRPVVLRRVGEGDETSVTATLASPGPEGPPLLRALSALGASSTSGHGEDDPAAFAPPRALVDGDPTTLWAEGRGGPGAQEFVVFRWNTRFPIRAFAVTPSPRAELGRRFGRPRRFWLVGDGGARLRVSLPDDALLHPGERYWIVPPEPLAWRCVALVLDEAYAPAGTRPAAVHTGVAEIEAFTELDWGSGIDRLVQIIVEGEAGGDEASRLLSNLGSAAVRALAAAWDRLDERGRRRAVRAFADATRRGAPEGIDALRRGAMDEAEPVRSSALEALGTLGPPAAEVLGRLVGEAEPVGEAAVRPMLRHPAPVATAAFVAALAQQGASERPSLRDGLGRAVAGNAEAREVFDTWAASDPPLAALASAALGLSGQSGARDAVPPVLSQIIGAAERFEDRFRIVLAARELPHEPQVDGWLADLVRGGAEEWMLRAAALDALEHREAPNREAAALDALEDDYPRVRIEAIQILDGRNTHDDRLVHLARRDSWPMVREAAVAALFDRPAGREAVRRSIRDRSPRVRRAALRTVTRAGDREAWSLVRARLEDDDEWPQVTIEALRYVRELCLTDAGELVLGVVRRGMRPGAWAPDVDVAAVAVDLALHLGGETAERAATIAGRESTPSGIRAVLDRGAGRRETCGAASSP